MNKPINPNNCPILERDGDGKSVGRCWYYLEDGICPRHGDVKEASNKYAETGELTDEKDFVGKSEEKTTQPEKHQKKSFWSKNNKNRWHFKSFWEKEK